MPDSPATLRRRIRVTGTVQGVGFRPFVYRQAVALGLAGFVRNDSAGVLVEVEGSADRVGTLCRLLVDEAPPLARVTGVDAITIEPLGGSGGFHIEHSAEDGSPAAPVSVDTATCAECLAEVDDPADRRYRYPFTNCTNCGPRYTIVRSVPYDRPATTMAGFTMCPACQQEYDDPADRRFHAQPNACPVCGPRLAWLDQGGRAQARGPEAMDAAARALREGAILAVKGIGGFHLATDATDVTAVAELRRRKARDDKPFAVMVSNLDQARRLCLMDPASEAALVSARRPVVLVPKRSAPGERGEDDLAPGVAPGLPELGLLLAYTPLHHLLIKAVGRPLVMTSGNLSDDPIAHTDEDAVGRLSGLVDGFLTHDRPIHIRCDDSVLRVTPPSEVGDGPTSRRQVLRRSRGFAPEPLALPAQARRQVLAVGAELKSTVSVAKARTLVTSHHIGDLEHLANYRAFLQAVDHLCHLYGVVPEVVAHDLHPEYLSTKLALDLDLPTWPVQHHHAHIASCLAEHRRTEAVLGLAFDGLGMGTDGTLWGGEYLVADLGGFTRVGNLAPVALPGGAGAIRQPWRMALSWARASLGADQALRLGLGMDRRAADVLALVESGSGPVTTSVGRLFDAVAALVGVRSAVTYEGQAAIELEALASSVSKDETPAYPVDRGWTDGRLVLDPRPLVASVVTELERGVPPSGVAAGFHRGLAEGAVSVAVELASLHGLDTVALSGGVFQNARLSSLMESGLRARGLDVLVHQDVPPNDGGISVGQAAIAALGPHR
ncbi:MAG: carbamoyltransferase HypF [Acidimicrobiales bacterium]|nr:MAG: carbamoyltransferase HypF [Acidimicrobiales bacterium]